MCAFYNRLSCVVELNYLFIFQMFCQKCCQVAIVLIWGRSSQLDKLKRINKIFLKICNYVRYYHLVDGNITVLEQYISKVALMSQNIYGTPVFFNFSLVQNYIMSYFHCNTIFEVYRWLKIFIFWLPLMYSRS